MGLADLLKGAGNFIPCVNWNPNNTTSSPINWRGLGISPSANHPMSNTNGGTGKKWLHVQLQ